MLTANGKRGGYRPRRVLLYTCLSLLSLISSPLEGAVPGNWELRPGIYGTWGQYTSATNSRDFSGYLTAACQDKYVLSVGYSDLMMDQEFWTYRQRLWIGGGLVRYGRLIGRTYYGHIRGDYRSRGQGYHYRDLTDLYSGELGIAYRRWNVGYEATYLTGIGGRTQRVSQQTARLSWSPDQQVLITFRPNYSWLLDGRRLTSAQLSASMNITQDLVLKLGGSGGKRAYYLDNDLLVIYNQNETQLGMAFVQFEVTVMRPWTLVTEYILTSFEGYDIAYLVLGLKGRFR